MENVPVIRTRFTKLALSKKIQLEDGSYDSAALTWSVRNGYPRITVWTSDKAYNKTTKKMDFKYTITAPFDYVNIGIFIDYIRAIVNADSNTTYKVNCYNVKYENNVKTNEVFLQATAIVGKDSEGVIYLALKEEGKRSIKFELLPDSKWFKFFDKDNNEITNKSILSKMYTINYVRVVSNLLEKAANNDLINIVKQETTSTKPSTSSETINTNNNEISIDSLDIDNLI